MLNRDGQLALRALPRCAGHHVAAWWPPSASEVTASEDFTIFTRMLEAENFAAVIPDDYQAELVVSETQRRELCRNNHRAATARGHFDPPRLDSVVAYHAEGNSPERVSHERPEPHLGKTLGVSERRIHAA
jgi:hypothetical protein